MIRSGVRRHALLSRRRPAAVATRARIDRRQARAHAVDPPRARHRQAEGARIRAARVREAASRRRGGRRDGATASSSSQTRAPSRGRCHGGGARRRRRWLVVVTTRARDPTRLDMRPVDAPAATRAPATRSVWHLYIMSRCGSSDDVRGAATQCVGRADEGDAVCKARGAETSSAVVRRVTPDGDWHARGGIAPQRAVQPLRGAPALGIGPRGNGLGCTPCIVGRARPVLLVRFGRLHRAHREGRGARGTQVPRGRGPGVFLCGVGSCACFHAAWCGVKF